MSAAGKVCVPEVRDAVGNAVRIVARCARRKKISQGGTQRSGPGPDRENAERHRVGGAHARAQAEALSGFPAGAQERMKNGERRGNDGRVENEETKSGVPIRFPQPLEVATRFHIPTAPTVYLCLPNEQQTKKRSRVLRSPHFQPFRLILNGVSAAPARRISPLQR